MVDRSFRDFSDQAGAHRAPLAASQPASPASGLRLAADGGPEAPRRPATSGAGDPAPVRLSQLVRISGALTSLALVLGLGFWGYRIIVRDVTGVPVIRALDGPARIAPEVPGGDQARHTGLSVNEVASDGSAAAPADRLALAPRADELDATALPMAALRPPPRAERAPVPTAEAGEVPAAPTEPAESLVATNLADPLDPGAEGPAGAEALAEELSAGAVPLGEVPAVDPAALPPAPQPLVILSRDVPGVAVSPRPPARPVSGVSPVPASAVEAALALALAPQTGLREVDPADLPAGTKLVQLGAYDDRATAEREWEKIAARFGTLMQDKGRVIQESEAGGRRFYRLRVEGFADLADARRFCAALLAEATSCIATQVR